MVLLWILGSSGVQIFAFIMLNESLGFFESVQDRECPVNGGRPYSWVPAKKQNNKAKKWANMKHINKRNEI